MQNMLPIKGTEDLLEDKEDPRSKARYSLLNVNATVFVPSTTAHKEDFTNSDSFTPEPDGQMQNSNMSSRAAGDNASSLQRQEYSDYLLKDQMKNLIGCETNKGGEGPQQRQEYTHSPYTSLGCLQDLSIDDRETNGGNATSSQRLEYRHSLYSSIGQENYGAASVHDTNFVEPVRLNSMLEYGYNVAFSAVDQTRVFDSGYEKNNNNVSKFQWQELAPIPCTEEHIFVNRDFTQCYKETCSTILLPGDDWDKQSKSRYKIGTSVAPCDTAWSPGDNWGNRPGSNYIDTGVTACDTAWLPGNDFGNQPESNYIGTGATFSDTTWLPGDDWSTQPGTYYKGADTTASNTALLPGDDYSNQLESIYKGADITTSDTALLSGDNWSDKPESNYKGTGTTAFNTALLPDDDCSNQLESIYIGTHTTTSDMALLRGDDLGNQSESNETGTSITASCPPEANSLVISSKLSSDNHMEVAGAAPQQCIVADETIDSKLITEDGLKYKKNSSISDEPAATLEDSNRVEEAHSLKNIKQSKKKIRPRADEEVFSNKEHVNIVFIGHVDAGKSTLGGQLMYATGMVDERTMKKYEKEAKEKSRDSWYLSWALDTNQEERDRGKTVETGRGHFETPTKHFTILDAPGHKSFVPNMICGTAQADVAVLVLSARQNEFESGFDKGGQTRDHAMLARSAGISVMIVLVNKMDDSTVKWNEKRFNYCRNKILPFLKKLGYAPSDVHFLPISAQIGDGIMTAVPKSTCPWFEGPSLIECLDKLSTIKRPIESPFVMPIAEKFKDMGTVVMGKVEAGTTHISHSLLVMPNKVAVTVEQLWSDDKPVTTVKAGENVKIRLKGIEEEDISPGFVLCDSKQPITTATIFDAQLRILDCKSIVTRGFSAVMHYQSVAENVTVTHLICLVDPKTNEKTQRLTLQYVKKGDEAIMRIQCSGVVCLTVFKEFNPLGRFTLRDDNSVIAIGKVLKIIK